MTTITMDRPRRLGLTAGVGALLVLIVILGAQSLASGAPSEPPAPTSVPGTPVQLAEVVAGPIQSALSYSGDVRAGRQVTVSPRAGGQVRTVLVDTGSTVRVGDVLATVDGTTQQAQLLQATAAVLAAQSRLDAMVAGSRTYEVQAAQAQFDAAQARWSQLLAPTASQRLEAEAAIKSAEAAVENARGSAERAKAVLTAQVWIYCDTWLKFGVDCANRTMPLTPAAVKDLEEALSSRFTDPLGVNGERAVGILEANGSFIAALSAVESGRAALDVATARRDALLSPAAADVAAATSAVEAARSGVERARTPFTDPEINGARAGVLQAQTLVTLAQAAVDDTVIRAPLEGVVTARELEVGAMASPAVAAFVISTGDAKVLITVDEARVGLVRPGLQAEVVVAAFPDLRFPASVASVAPSADAQTHTFEVTLLVQDPDRALLPGMFAQVLVITATSPRALLVPASAIIAQAERTSVFVVKDGRAEQQSVRTGLADGTSVEVLSGVAAGERVVVVGQSALRDGQTVAVSG